MEETEHIAPDTQQPTNKEAVDKTNNDSSASVKGEEGEVAPRVEAPKAKEIHADEVISEGGNDTTTSPETLPSTTPNTSDGITNTVETNNQNKRFDVTTDKDNLFYVFDLHRKRASRHENYSTDLYLDYNSSFDNDKKKIISAFRELYEANKNDITVLDEATDKEKAVVIEFLDWTDKLPKRGIWFFRFIHWVKGLFAKKTRKKTGDVKDERPKRKDIISEKDYLNERYFVAQKFYSKRADEGKKFFFRIQKGIFALSVIIPIIALIPKFVETIIKDLDLETPMWVADAAPVLTAVLSAIIAYMSSKDKLYSWLKHWTKNRDLSERLKKEYALYQGRSGEYAKLEGETIEGHTPAERKFRENVEQIIEDGRETLNAYGSRKSEGNGK